MSTSTSTMINTPDQIAAFRLMALKGAVKLECLGMKRRGRPATVIAREVLGLPKSSRKAAVLAALEKVCDAFPIK